MQIRAQQENDDLEGSMECKHQSEQEGMTEGTNDVTMQHLNISELTGTTFLHLRLDLENS